MLYINEAVVVGCCSDEDREEEIEWTPVTDIIHAQTVWDGERTAKMCFDSILFEFIVT